MLTRVQFLFLLFGFGMNWLTLTLRFLLDIHTIRKISNSNWCALAIDVVVPFFPMEANGGKRKQNFKSINQKISVATTCFENRTGAVQGKGQSSHRHTKILRSFRRTWRVRIHSVSSKPFRISRSRLIGPNAAHHAVASWTKITTSPYCHSAPFCHC